MFIADILLAIVAMSFVVMLWVMLFFIFDTEVLNGYFKKKLQKRFNVNEVE